MRGSSAGGIALHDGGDRAVSHETAIGPVHYDETRAGSDRSYVTRSRLGAVPWTPGGAGSNLGVFPPKERHRPGAATSHGVFMNPALRLHQKRWSGCGAP